MLTFAPRMDVLPPPQQAIWNELAFASNLGFVLYGGTAVALRLGHRDSVDFDFFSDRAFDKNVIIHETSLMVSGEVIQDESNTLTLSVQRAGGPVKVSFFGSLGPNIIAGRVGRPATTDDGVLEVASLEDLFATKVKTILDRAEAKDYRDIAAMLRAGHSLERALGSAIAIFGKGYEPMQAIKALNFYGDGDLSSVSKEDRELLIRSAASIRDVPAVSLASSRLVEDDRQPPSQIRR